MGLSSAERQKAYRERQAAKGQTPVTMLLTKDEAFYLQRVLEQMRREGSVPAQMRLKNGRMSTLDA